MYKIYINQTPLILTNAPLREILEKKDASVLVGQYDGKVKTLFRYIDQCEKIDRFKEVWILYNDVEKLFEDFNSLYQRMDAAGGLILNAQNEILLMYRRGMWDLPKGKIEDDESVEEAAVREVSEETGIEVQPAIFKLCDTYHTFRINQKRILKKTYWYVMTYKCGKLVPEVGEGIEKLEWITEDNALKKKKIYKNIKSVIHTYLAHKTEHTG